MTASVSRIEVHGWTPHQWKAMAMDKIFVAIGGHRKEWLRQFECGSIFSESVQEALELRDEIERCYMVNGFMSIDGEHGRAFEFLIEKGLSWEDANDLADKLADQMRQCADRMEAEAKNNRKQWEF